MAELDDLSTTDASNTGRFPENQAPSSVNNGARALEGMIARFVQDINTSVAATVSGSVIQMTANHTSLTLTGTTSNYRANLLIGFTMGSTPNPSPCSLNIDGVGPISLRDNAGATLSSSVLLAGARALAVKDGDNDYFRLLWPHQDQVKTGNWTPVLTFATAGNLSVAYDVQIGRYTRIGSLVSIDGAIDTSSFTHTTASGDMTITGLPFTAANDEARAHGQLRWGGVTKANYSDLHVQVVPNTTTMIVGASGSGQAPSTVQSGDAPSGGDVLLRFSVTYRAQ